ncbi:MAG: helix-turn-helix domain-containing protein [Mycobacterium sp.]
MAQLHQMRGCLMDAREELPDSTPPPTPNSGRSVLDGAFAVLDALGRADTGLGLSDLCRQSGLAKASTYRLAEQLVSLGAVRRHERRYYIGARLGRIGQRWEPDPPLRTAARRWVHTLAVRSKTIVSMSILVEGRLHLVCGTALRGHPGIPAPGHDVIGRTATGQVLYAARHAGACADPDCLTAAEWKRLRSSIRELNAAVVEQQDVMAGTCCVSAPAWYPNGRCAGAVTALVESNTIPPALRDLVVRTARKIGAELA